MRIACAPPGICCGGSTWSMADPRIRPGPLIWLPRYRPNDMATRHESAHLHVSGRALYTDDIPLPSDTLHAAFGLSSIAHGRIRTMDLAPVQAFPGVFAVATAADV